MEEEKQIPNDIVFDILVKLSVKSLVRFTTVCKSWSSLIKNSEFVAAHQRYTKLSTSNECHFLNIGKDSYSIFSNDIDSQEQQKSTKWPLGFRFMEIIGRSCYGLLCLTLMNDDCGRSGIFLWNPSIQKFKILDRFYGEYQSYSNGDPDNTVVYGFGYNVVSNDHMVIRVNFINETNSVDVFRISTRSWHQIQQPRVPTSLRKHLTNGMYLDGGVHWLTTVFDEEENCYFLNSIVLFDFRHESFRDIELPSELQVEFDLFGDFMEFKGSIALLIGPDFWGEQCCLWVMDEYGVAESWTKKFTIDVPGDFYSLWPLELLKDGTIVLKIKKSGEVKYPFVLYDIEKGRSTDLSNLKNIENVVDFSEMENLLLLDLNDDLSEIF